MHNGRFAGYGQSPADLAIFAMPPGEEREGARAGRGGGEREDTERGYCTVNERSRVLKLILPVNSERSLEKRHEV